MKLSALAFIPALFIANAAHAAQIKIKVQCEQNTATNEVELVVSNLGQNHAAGIGYSLRAINGFCDMLHSVVKPESVRDQTVLVKMIESYDAESGQCIVGYYTFTVDGRIEAYGNWSDSLPSWQDCIAQSVVN